MTSKEALEIITNAIQSNKNMTAEQDMALAIAQKALEKQIPKKPLDITTEYDGDYGRCPCCGMPVSDFHEMKRCGSCGQALDWH